MHKYLRNKQYKEKCQKRAKRELPKWNFHCWLFSPITEEKFQKLIDEYHEDYEKEILQIARHMDKGCHTGVNCAPKWYVRTYNSKRRAQAKNHMRHKRYDSIERERNDAEYDYF